MAVLKNFVLLVCLLASVQQAIAAETVALPDSSDVLDRMHAMDSDGDGMASVSEIRAFLQAQPGEAYKTAALDDWEATAMGRRCSSPFGGFAVSTSP